MSELVPHRLLFRFEISVRYRSAPTVDGDLSDWTDDYLLPELGAIEGHEPFGRIWLGWNEAGLYLAARVEGRRSGFQCDPASFDRSDHLRLLTDMRDTRDIKRASRYCQQFFFMPAGAGPNRRAATAGSARIGRAAEHAPLVPAGLLEVASQRTGDAYTLEAHIPAECLFGFDPREHSRIGLCTLLQDTELGRQYLTVDDALNWSIDPSTWATAVLVRE